MWIFIPSSAPGAFLNVLQHPLPWEGLPCIMNSSKTVWDPPDPAVHVLQAPALLILSSRTEISNAVPYAFTLLTHSEVKGDFTSFTEQNWEDRQHGWVNGELQLEYPASKTQQCHSPDSGEVDSSSGIKHKWGLQIKARLLKGARGIQAHVSERMVHLVGPLLVPSNPNLNLHWDNASEREWEDAQGRNTGGCLPASCGIKSLRFSPQTLIRCLSLLICIIKRPHKQ